MIREIEIREEGIAATVLALQRSSYAIEAEIIGFADLPPLTEDVEDLRTCGEEFYGYFVGERLAGAVSFVKDDGLLDIFRLFVGPEYFRRGIARELLRFVQEREGEVERFVVRTGTRNEPAMRLYRAEGFVERDESEVAPGLYVTRFEKRGPASRTARSPSD